MKVNGRRHAAALVVALVASTLSLAQPSPNPFGIPLAIEVPVTPTPFSAGGKTHLAYELHLTNFGSTDVSIGRVDVLGAGASLVHFEGTELTSVIATPGRTDLPDNRVVGPGLRTVVFVWVTLEQGAAIPEMLRHRITSGNQVLEAAEIRVSRVAPTRIGAPFRGSDWIAGNGPSNKSPHRRALVPIDAVVASVKDGIPENVPGLTSRAVPITRETVGGNYVILELSDHRFAFYAHLQPGSLRVKAGDQVRRGQVLGLLGNSGNSTEPHLHFHVAEANAPLGSEGLPYAFESFHLGDDANKWNTRRGEMPLENARVRFP